MFSALASLRSAWSQQRTCIAGAYSVLGPGTVDALRRPPRRSLSAEDRALLWRFRWALTGEKRALTRVLACVDWSDAAEARQGISLAVAWTSVDTSTALQLLSPDFQNPEAPPPPSHTHIRARARTHLSAVVMLSSGKLIPHRDRQRKLLP